MIEISEKEIKLIEERDKYKTYLLVSLMAFFWLFTMFSIVYIDINKQDKVIEEYQEDLAYMTGRLLTVQSKLTEIESDSKMLEELGK